MHDASNHDDVQGPIIMHYAELGLEPAIKLPSCGLLRTAPV